jgi:hypothetical protein
MVLSVNAVEFSLVTNLYISLYYHDYKLYLSW